MAGNTYIYRMLGCHCKTCPIKESCLSGKQQLKDQTKKINRNIYEDYINRAKEHSKTKEFKAHVHERFWKMEGLFAEGKENHCLRRAKYRGIGKVQVQVKMTSIVQNLKRILKFTEEKLQGPKSVAIVAGHKACKTFRGLFYVHMLKVWDIVAIFLVRMNELKKLFKEPGFSTIFG